MTIGLHDLPRDSDQLRAMLEDAYAQLGLYTRDLQKLIESEKSARAELLRLKNAPNVPAPPIATPGAHEHASSLTELGGQSPAMRRALHLCSEVARTDASVILTGETGVGKEVAARTIHRLSRRSTHPFVAVNCAALPETLLESELFGHEKGAFTGAVNRKPGHFEMAEGGTLLLDEIGEMPLPMQAKLLRVLEQRCFLRVGGVQLIHGDVRIIAATNRDVKDEIKAGRFRSDLYYRLNVFPIDLPPLRDRLEDLPMLIDQIAHRYAARSGTAFTGISDAANTCLYRHAWPGNIRELRNVIERSMILARDRVIEPEDLPTEIVTSAAETFDPLSPSTTPSSLPHSRLAASEKAMVIDALRKSGWNKAAAARELGISWDNLRYRIKKYKIKKPEEKALM